MHEINFHIPAHEIRFCNRCFPCPCAPQHRVDPGHKLAAAKRFSDIVIGADFQAFHFVLFFILGAKHNNRNRRPLPQPAAGLKPIHPGHNDIQHHQVGCFPFHQFQRFRAVSGLADTNKNTNANAILDWCFAHGARNVQRVPRFLTGLGAYLAMLWAMGLESEIETFADPDRDETGKQLDLSRQPRRVAHSKDKHDGDF